MGKHSGGLLDGDDIYVYRKGGEEYFTDEYRQSMNEIYDDEVDFGDFAQNIIKLFGKIDFEEKKFFILQMWMSIFINILCLPMMMTIWSMNGTAIQMKSRRWVHYLNFSTNPTMAIYC